MTIEASNLFLKYLAVRRKRRTAGGLSVPGYMVQPEALREALRKEIETIGRTEGVPQ